MKTARAIAIVIVPLIAVVLAGGCAAVTHPRVLGGGPMGFWSRSRLRGAMPFLPGGRRAAPQPRQFFIVFGIGMALGH
jgi:hypothetical protein